MSAVIDRTGSPAAVHQDMPGAAVRVIERIDEFDALFAPEPQLVVWNRPAIGEIADYCSRWAQHGRPAGRVQLLPGEAFPVDLLPPGSGRDALVEDVARLSELLGDLLGCPRIGARIEVLDRAMCPRFHVDRVAARLLCTYHGPGTEWLNPGCAPENPPTSAIHTLPAFAVALCKGTLWPNNPGGGLIHRSAAVAAGERRVLLALDGLW